MVDFLDILVRDVENTIDEGYYENGIEASTSFSSLKDAIIECSRAPIIAEIKVASPSSGEIITDANVENIARAMKNGGAIGISILTEPTHFKGSLRSFQKVRKQVQLPLLMKDIIISPIQLEAASRIGANAVLLIMSIFKRNHSEYSVHKMIQAAHSMNLEVLLEAHTKAEFSSALKTEADLIGINNRDLKTFKIDLKATQRILLGNENIEKTVVSESGVMTQTDIRFLHKCGAQAFLVGSAIMKANNIEEKVRELMIAL